MKFLVTSCCPDEQQVFSDFVDARDADAAALIVAEARDYATIADVMDVRELQELVERLRAATDVPSTAFALTVSLSGEDAALAVGTRGQLNDWASDPADRAERFRRRVLVDGELATREHLS